jgi:phage terminase small subunit
VGVPKKLTEKQIIFVHELISNEGQITATEAAIRAGYPESSARQQASKLQNVKYYPLVCEEIKRVREEVQKKYNVTIDRHFKELQKIRDAAVEKESYSAAVQAEVARGKAAGLYINEMHVKHSKIDQLTDAEVQERLSDLMSKMNVIEVDSEEVKD